MCSVLRSLRCLAALVCLLASGCGAGLITGVAASNNNGTTSEARPPELTLSPLLPLVPVANTTRTVVVANAQIPAASRLRVRIEAAGVGVDQLNPTAAGQGGSTTITYTLDTAPFVAALGGNTSADVDGTLRVLVDDLEVAAAAVLLVRQPTVQLVVEPGQPQLFVSPFGQLVRLRATGLRSTTPTDVQMLVRTLDPTRPIAGGVPPTVTRVCTALRFEAAAVAGEVVVAAVVPGSSFPVQAELFLRDALSGESTVAENAFYRPDIALALPSQGSTTGGSLVTLIGTALVPYDFSAASGLPPLSFDAVEVSFAKGGRVTALSREDFRTAESGSDRLVFTMPAAPDGRPGQVDIVLRVQLDGALAQVTASQVFLFANPQPFFGPRGAVLDRPPVAVSPIALDAAPGGDDAPDFAVLYEEGGVAFLQLLLAQENGMFQRFGAPRQVGDHEVAAERGPRDLCTGDFDGDLVPDMFIANVGAATAVHHLVLGQARPNTPLGGVHRIPADPGTWRCRAARFDGDATTDLLLVPGPDAPAGLLPQVLLARPVGAGQPAFAPPIYVPVRSFDYEAIEVADLDGDGALDVAVASGTTLQLDVAHGRGDGTFDPAVPLDFVVPGYTPDPESPAVGLHACRDGVLQSLGLVLAGRDAALTRPTVAVLRQNTARAYGSPLAGEVTPIPTDPLGQSLAADLDQSNTLELAIAVRGEPTLFSLGLLRFGPNGFTLIAGGIETGAELPRQIRALHFDRAFPATPLSGEAKAVFVVHESEIDGARERRLSTRLLFIDSATQSLTLLPPDAGAPVASVVESIVGGNFHAISVAGAGSVRDLALARGSAIELLENDGFGGFPRPSNRLDFAGLLPRTVTLLPGGTGEYERLLFANDASRLGVWRHDPSGAAVQVPDAVTAELRLAISDPRLSGAALSNRTALRVADVDGDGLPDLTALLSFVLPAQGEGDARIALLRGKPAPGPGEFPFFEPTVLTAVHGNATSIALGDFARAGQDLSRQLELAVTVPQGTTAGALDGDHVRFFRYVAGASPAGDHFEPSATPNGPQVLLAGSGPTQVVAGDFDRDGSVDLLVAAAADNTLRLFRNTAAPTGAQGHVDLQAFQESLSSPRPLSPGLPTALRLGDVNGDGSLDAIVVVEFRSPSTNELSTSVAFHLSSGTGEFANPTFVSPTRVGDRDAELSSDLGDWNRDGVLDLFLGWNTAGPGDRNVRVLFGGTR